MNLGRLWRTVRHLNADQWRYRVIRRGRYVCAGLAPAAWARRLERQSERLEFADPAATALAGVADQLLVHQTVVHGDHLNAMNEGRFTLLGHTEDFGAAERIDWRRETADGNGLLWRLNLAYMGYAVPWLASGEAADLARAAAVLRALEAGNPWHMPGVFRDVWNPYTVSHRLINLLAGLHLHGRAGGTLAAPERELFFGHLRRLAAYIAGNLEKDLQFNHLMKNYVALAVYAAALPALPATWHFLAAETKASVRQNFLTDGGHAERSPMYHLLGLQDLRLLRATGLFDETREDWLEPVISKAAAALRLLSHPDGDIALFNDAWFDEAPSAAALVRDAPTPGRHDLPETGYVRLDGGNDAVIFDVGPCGPDENPAHAHADFLSLEASVGGARFLVDPGTPAYAPGPLRDLGRSAAQHNGPHLEGDEPLEFWAAFRVGRRGNAEILPGLDGHAPLAVAGRQNGYAHLGVGVSRFVGLWPDQGMLIVDAWTGPAAGRAATRFLIPRVWRPAGAEGMAFQCGGTTVRAEVLAGDAGSITEAEWWPHFGVAARAQALCVKPQPEPDGHFLAVRFVWGDGEMLATADLSEIRRALTAS